MFPPRLAAFLQSGHHLEHLVDAPADLLALLAQQIDLLRQIPQLFAALLRGVDLRLRGGQGFLQVPRLRQRRGQNSEITQLNKEFRAKYPNVTIKRNSKSFTNLKDTLKLALSGTNPPDVVEANQGYPDMGAFVKAGMLQPLDGYAQRYDWQSRYPKTLLDLNRFTTDGASFGSGSLRIVLHQLVFKIFPRMTISERIKRGPFFLTLSIGILSDHQLLRLVISNSMILPEIFYQTDKASQLFRFGRFKSGSILGAWGNHAFL